jgi:hypothetical protein
MENNFTAEISIPLSKSCDCKLHLRHRDIVNIAIKPTIESVVSLMTAAIANLDLFGLYWIEHIFVTFNYTRSVFHRSYKQLIKHALQRFFKVSLKKKSLKIPYTIFPESEGGIMRPLLNEKFILADSFIYGNILQASSETYGFQFTLIGKPDVGKS